MNAVRRFFRRLRWVLFGGALHLLGCSDPKDARSTDDKAVACSTKGAFLIALHGGTCSTEVQLALDNLVRMDPDCNAIFGDAGVKVVCNVPADAGAGQ